MVGVLILDPVPAGSAAALSALQAAAREAGYLVSFVGTPPAGRRGLLGAVGRLRNLAAEGVLILAPGGGAIEVLTEIAGELPAVAVGAGPQDVISSVAIDHYTGAAAATRHLLELGHRTVFHVAGPPDRHDSRLRLAGWRDALLAAGVQVPPPLLGDLTPASGYRLGRRLALDPDVSAIFASGDQMALGVLHALHERERRIPDEVSVVGFDGLPAGEFFTPPLTTIRQDFAALGRCGFELLRREIEDGPQAKVHRTIPTELILRASTTTASHRIAPSRVPALSASGRPAP